MGQVDVNTRNVALDRECGHEKCGSGQGVWTREMWLWTGDVDTSNVALDRRVWTRVMWLWTGDVDTSNVVLDRRVWTRVMWLWTEGVDTSNVALDRGCGHVYVALGRRV